MIRSLHLKNFKTWTEVTLDFGSITGLFGTNSSVKTSLIQFLLMLKQTKEATDRAITLDLKGPYVDLGSYKDVIHGHDEKRELAWSLAFSTPEPISIVDPSKTRRTILAKSSDLSVSGCVGTSELGPRSHYLSYRVGSDQTFTLTRKRSEEAFELAAAGSEFRFIRTPGRAWQLPGPIKAYAFPDQARTYFQNASFLSDLEKAYEDQIDGIYYLGPLREHPRRDYTWARSRPRDVGPRGEKAVEAILAATIANETRNLKPKARLRSFQEMIAYWLAEMGLIENFRIEELAPGSNYWQARVSTREGGTEAALTDVGFGVSQVLPIITLLYYVPEYSTVVLEQPEIHLHPSAQAHLADLLINVAKHRNLQVVIESHSEHLLLRLQRRVAEDCIASDDVKLYFCDWSDGASRLKALELDGLGQIQNWPANFMGNALGETIAAERARLQRLKGMRG